LGKLFIQSGERLEIGSIRTGIWDPWYNFLPDQRVLIVAEATEDDWVNCVVTFGEEQAWAEMLACLDPYFYEIRTD
jgi:hypothetical protein